MENIEFNLKEYLDDRAKSDREYLDERFGAVITRQDHTNGSVADATRDIGKLKVWQERIIGGAIVLGVVSGTFAFILREQIDFFLHPEVRIRQAVEAAIADTEVEVEIK